MKKVRVTTTFKPGIKDNQGIAIQKVLETVFDYDDINSLRIGKIFDIEVEDSVTDQQIEKIAKAVSNPIMDNFKIEFVDD